MCSQQPLPSFISFQPYFMFRSMSSCTTTLSLQAPNIDFSTSSSPSSRYSPKTIQPLSLRLPLKNSAIRMRSMPCGLPQFLSLALRLNRSMQWNFSSVGSVQVDIRTLPLSMNRKSVELLCSPSTFTSELVSRRCCKPVKSSHSTSRMVVPVYKQSWLMSSDIVRGLLLAVQSQSWWVKTCSSVVRMYFPVPFSTAQRRLGVGLAKTSGRTITRQRFTIETARETKVKDRQIGSQRGTVTIMPREITIIEQRYARDVIDQTIIRLQHKLSPPSLFHLPHPILSLLLTYSPHSAHSLLILHEVAVCYIGDHSHHIRLEGSDEVLGSGTRFPNQLHDSLHEYPVECGVHLIQDVEGSWFQSLEGHQHTHCDN